MATPRTATLLLPPLRRTLLPRPLLLQPPTSNHNQTRTFLPLPPTTPHHLTATRTLPYPLPPIYSIIADIPSYSTFLPYCTSSAVTAWSQPDKLYHRRWPRAGILTVGFGGVSESFASRVYCLPGRVVESVGGGAERSVGGEGMGHYDFGGEGSGEKEKEEGGLLSHLRSKWTVEEGEKAGKTKVTMELEFAFRNPVYGALSAGAAPKVAEMMIRAFEGRVEGLLRGDEGMCRAGLGELEGSGLKGR